MKAVGVIAEYNPLHNGHIYHIDSAGTLSGADAVVVAMSGNYVQRGEPAILDKWTRTESALKCGADLVVEIPALFCLGNAGQYASAGVRILEGLGKISHLAFGSKYGDASLLTEIADNFRNNAEAIYEEVRKIRKSGYSYPAARELAYVNVISGLSGTDPESDPHCSMVRKVLNSSNDILALEYILASDRMQPLAIKRAGAGYDDPYDIKFEYQSASAIRTRAFDDQDVGRYVPACTAGNLKNGHITGIGRDKWFDTLRYAVLSAPVEMIEDCPSGGEGLANLMKKEIRTAENWGQFVRRVQSKRYTYTRISRLCMQVLLGITRTKYPYDSPGYIRVLGFNDKGRQLLAEIKADNAADLPVITNINKELEKLDAAACEMLELEKYAGDIYHLMCGKELTKESDSVHAPVII